MWNAVETEPLISGAVERIQSLASSIDLKSVQLVVLRELPFILIFVGLAAVLAFYRKRRAYVRALGVDLRSLTRGPLMLGYATALLFFGGFGTWAATAVLASAVVAPGVVSPDGYRKTIQHLEGGIIRTIQVREGDTVAAGQILITLEAVDAQGRYDELRERYAHFLVVEARLAAELAGQRDIPIRPEVKLLGSERLELIIAGQQELLNSRRAARTSQEQILRKRVRQIEEENGGLREVIESKDVQLSLIDREIAGARHLYDQGLERLPRLLALERAQAEIKAGQAANRSQILRNEQQIGETEIQIVSLGQRDREDLSDEITKVGAMLADLRSQLPLRENVLARTAIVAPISGTVMNLRVTTETGVIASGEPILEIVPYQPHLIIDARVKPIDIDTVRPRMRTRVVLSAFPQRHLPQIHGVLRSVSADRLIDDRTGEGYFLAKVEVDPKELQVLPDVELTPGMPADVMILTGEHTLLDYLIAPLRDSLVRSFREL